MRPSGQSHPQMVRPRVKFLNETQRTEPSADGAPESHAEEQENAHHIPTCPVAGRSQRILQRAERTCSHSSGAGITIKTGSAGVLRRPLVNLSVNKAFQMRIVKQRTVKLNESSCRGTEGFPSDSICIIQGLYTPYKSLPLCQKHLLRFR